MKTIDGQMLKQMILSASNNLFNLYPKIDALNVFPVPDGDTGTNMNLTLTSGAKEVMNLNSDSVYDISKSFSKGLLMGARGNSGVILSQIFRGFSQGLEGKKTINVREFSEAFVKGKEVAYKAVLRPVEGTILTVIRESSDALSQAYPRFSSIIDAMEYLISEAKKSLNRTPELLPVLKEVGVVDSGGAGLLTVFDGFLAALKGKIIERNVATSMFEPKKSNENLVADANIENQEFGYCTEFILDVSHSDKKSFNEKKFTNDLLQKGNSLVVVHDEDIVKVHIHTLTPGFILTYAQQFGEFVTLKIENMQEQHNNLMESSVEEPVKQIKEYALISVSTGKGIDDYFKQLRVDKIVSGGQTMNPSTEDFIQAIKEVNAKNVFIMPNNSNIIMAANQARDVMEDCTVHVIPTKTIPQGLLACMMFNPESDIESNVTEMSDSINRVKSGQITFSIKDTKINNVEIKANQYLGIQEKNIVACSDNIVEVAQKLLDSMIDDDSALVTIIYGENIKEEEATNIKDLLLEKYSLDVEVYFGGQPVYSYIFGVE